MRESWAMRRELLRTIIQKRFTMMNRWCVAAGELELNFCKSGDPLFRSLVFRAFDSLVRQLRQPADPPVVALLEELRIAKTEYPSFENYRRFWEIGCEIVIRFIDSDATVKRRFSETERVAAGYAVEASVKALLQREFAQFSSGEASAAEAHCLHCGQKLPQDGRFPVVSASKQRRKTVQKIKIEDDQSGSD